MKGLLFLLIILFETFSSFSQSNIDVLHYKFELILNDNNDTIYGVAEMKIKFRQPSSSFYIDLTCQNKQGKGMKVDNVSSAQTFFIKNYTAENDKLIIILSKEANVNDIATIAIQYHGIPADGLIISKNKYGDRTFFADNW